MTSQSQSSVIDPPRPQQADEIDVSVVIPCLNEAESIEICIEKALGSFERLGLNGEVVVADNGSTDGSPDLAEAAGARVVYEDRPGYGSAYLAGFAAAKGKYILMGDGDDTYDFSAIDPFIEELDKGAEMVIGNRMADIQPGAMPWLHRYIGNPVLTGVLNLFFRTGVTDAHCGMRGFRREALERLDLKTTGMEFASEMVIRSSKAGLKVSEVPITYHPRIGDSKLNSFSDGWRHLRFLLVHSPTHLFLIPGLVMFTLGLLTMVVVLTDVNVFGRSWDLHTMIVGSLLAIAGGQVAGLGLCAKAYGVQHLGEHDKLLERFEGRVGLEQGILAGGLVLLVGLGLVVAIVVEWAGKDFQQLTEERLAVFAATLVVLGLQVIFTSFFMSIVHLHRLGRPHGSS